jgi:lysyl-tRNA synthetase class 2
VPRVAGLLTAALGLMDIASALTPGLRDRLQMLLGFVPGSLVHVAVALTAATGVLLLLLGHGLRRRKRVAWRLALMLLALSVVLNLAKGLDYEESLSSLVALVALARFQGEFYAVADPRSRWSALRGLLAVAIASLAIGLALLALHPRALAGRPSFGDRFREVVAGFAGLPGPVRIVNPHFADLEGDLLLALGVLIVVVTVALLLRPSKPLCRLRPADEARLRDLLVVHGGRDSLGYFALRRDKCLVWSPTGKACVSYRVVNGVMLASGDPLGDPEAWPGAITAFLEIAGRHAWVPAVMGCSERGGVTWARVGGLEVLEIGDEAVVRCAEFGLDGRDMRNVRQAVARVQRAGYCAQLRRMRDVPAAEVDELRQHAAAWRGGATERGFSMALGRMGDKWDGDCVVATARDEQGRLRALLHFVPWGEDGLSLDLMRRDRAAENGVNEFLIVETVRQAGSLGIGQISLNFAAFRSALARGERLGAGPVMRATRWGLLFLSRWFQIESLYRFNAKFEPHWQPRFACYHKAAEIPRAALAVLEAEAFLVRPRPARQLATRLRGAWPARPGRLAA